MSDQVLAGAVLFLILVAVASATVVAWRLLLPRVDDEEPTDDVPTVRLRDAAGWVRVGSETVHRACADARRDARPHDVCDDCSPLLGGTTPSTHRRTV